MTEKLTAIHAVFRYLILIIIPLITCISYYNWKKQLPYKKFHEILARINIGVVHSQMLIGIVLMTHSPKVNFELLAAPYHLFWSIVHPAILFAAIIFVTLALMVVRNKKQDADKHRLSFVYNLIAFLLVILGLSLRSLLMM